MASSNIMTRYERLTLLMSGAALVISVAAPTALWWLERTSRAMVEFSTVELHSKDGYSFEIHLENVGTEAAHDVIVQMKPFANWIRATRELSVQAEPLSPVALTSHNDTISITVNRAIGPGNKMVLVIRGFTLPEIGGRGLLIAKVYSDQGEALHVHSASRISSELFDY